MQPQEYDGTVIILWKKKCNILDQQMQTSNDWYTIWTMLFLHEWPNSSKNKTRRKLHRKWCNNKWQNYTMWNDHQYDDVSQLFCSRNKYLKRDARMRDTMLYIENLWQQLQSLLHGILASDEKLSIPNTVVLHCSPNWPLLACRETSCDVDWIALLTERRMWQKLLQCFIWHENNSDARNNLVEFWHDSSI